MQNLLEVVKPGDLVGFSGYDLISFLINIGSVGLPGYDIAHIGIIGPDMFLYESMIQGPFPCEIQGKITGGPQAQQFERRVQAFRGKVYLFPLIKPLKPDQLVLLEDYLKSEMGKPYDYMGALRAGGKLMAWLQGMFYPASDKFLFCSEYCAFAHHCVDVFRTVNESKWSPNALIRGEREQGVIGKAIRIR